MRKDRCCPIDSDIRVIWEKELQNDFDSLQDSNIDEVAELLKLLSNPIRLRIVMLLFKRDYCVCELVVVLKEKQNLVSYNLGILKKHDIIDSYKNSNDKYYKLNSDGNAKALIDFIKENLLTGF